MGEEDAMLCYFIAIHPVEDDVRYDDGLNDERTDGWGLYS